MVRFPKIYLKFVSAFVILTFVGMSIIPPDTFAQGVNLPLPGTMLTASPSYTPTMISGMTLNLDNPLQMDFLINLGDEPLDGEALNKETKKLVNYFLAALTVPDDEMWVNLSPYEKDRIIADGLSKTEMGRDMLVMDYLLKQLSASMINPEDDLGKEFWGRVHKKAKEQFGSTDVPMDTFNKIWIVPEQAVVYVHDKSVFVIKSHLNVMLEEDYLALELNQNNNKHGLGDVKKEDLETIRGVSKQIIREILIPEIEKEVNEGKNFANLRQMYNSMILATWYKQNLKESLLGEKYTNQNKVNGIDLADPKAKEKIYNQYIEAFKKGVFNFIKEDYDAGSKETIPRKYFSGGLKGMINGVRPGNARSAKDWAQLTSQYSHVKTRVDLAMTSNIGGAGIDTINRVFHDDIENFTEIEKGLFQRAQEIKGLKIGIDLEGTLTTSHPRTVVQQFAGHFELARKGMPVPSIEAIPSSFYEAPGWKPVMLGLLANNSVKIITAAHRQNAMFLISKVVWLKKAVEEAGVELIDRDKTKELWQANDFPGKEQVDFDDIWERNRFYQSDFKHPQIHDFDVLIDNNPQPAGVLLRYLDPDRHRTRSHPSWFIHADTYDFDWFSSELSKTSFGSELSGDPVERFVDNLVLMSSSSNPDLARTERNLRINGDSEARVAATKRVERIINALKAVENRKDDAMISTNEHGLMGRWEYKQVSFDSQSGQIILKSATRIPRKDGVVEPEFLIHGENEPRDIVLQTRELTSDENKKLAAIRMELGIRATPVRVIVRDESSIKNRIYGLGADKHIFLREDIIQDGDQDQLKEALDHESKELSKSHHDDIRVAQHSGGLRDLIRQLSKQDKQEGLVHFNNMRRVWEALDHGEPVIDESSQYAIRLYFLDQGIHVVIQSHFSIYVSNMGGNHRYRDYQYDGDAPGEQIVINEDDKEQLKSKVRNILNRIRADSGVNEFLIVLERDEKETERMAVLKKKYARPVVTDERERGRLAEELNELLDVDIEELSAEQTNRIQELAAALGYDPFYTPEKRPYDESPDRPMDQRIYDIKQGDVLYIQYGIQSRDNREEVVSEVEGYMQEMPAFGQRAVVTMVDGTEVNLNNVREVIVDDGRGGHYKVDHDRGSMEVYYFLTGGHLEPEVIEGELLEGATVEEDGLLKGRINWPGINPYLRVKFILHTRVTKEDAWRRMTGEKVVVLEAPNEQNNGVFIYKRANGRFGDHDMVDVNRIYFLGVDSEVSQLSTHQFKKGDRVVVSEGGKLFYGSVDSFYAKPFVGRRMVVKLDAPPNPQKPYVHVKFVSELEGALIDAKNLFSKSQVEASFKKMYDKINEKISRIDERFIQRADVRGTMQNFWDQFASVYEILFGESRMFDVEDFNLSALDSMLQESVNFSLQEMEEGIVGSSELGDEHPLSLLSSLLNGDEKTELQRAIQDVRFAINIFAGRGVAKTGTIPWVVKEHDLFRVSAGQAPHSDFTLSSMFRYFDDGTTSFGDKLWLAWRLSRARERYALEAVLKQMAESRDELEQLSPADVPQVADRFVQNLQDPDDVGVVKLILGIDVDGGDRAMIGKKIPGGIDFNPANVNFETKGNRIKFDMPTDPALLNTPIDGLYPVIINVTPVNINALLGLADEDESGQISLNPARDPAERKNRINSLPSA